MNSEPTSVFSSIETAIEIGRQISWDKNNYLSSTNVYFDGDEKRVSKITNIISILISSTSPQANVISRNAL